MLPKFVYFGTPSFSTLVLEALVGAEYLPAAVVTTPDKPAGRGLEVSESPVKKWAVAHGIPVLQFETFDDTALEALRAVGADLYIVAAYGKILPATALSIPPRGALNVHPSLLPRYRGTSPIESQILEDEKNIGVSIILMDEKMDHGPVLAQEEIAVDWPIGRWALTTLLWERGGKLLAEVLPHYLAGEIVAVVQDEAQATYTKKMQKEDGEIVPGTEDRKNYLKYLAYESWPGVYFFKDDKRVKITKASFANDQFIIERVVPEGKREMSYEDFVRG